MNPLNNIDSPKKKTTNKRKKAIRVNKIERLGNNRFVGEYIKQSLLSPWVCTYFTVNGFAKNIKDNTMVTAFRPVVTEVGKMYCY